MNVIHVNEADQPVWGNGWKRPKLCKKCYCDPECECEKDVCIPSMIHYMQYFVFQLELSIIII